MIHVIARIQVKPGKMNEFMRILKANVPAVLAEDGCHGYAPCVDFETGLPPQGGAKEDMVTILEQWESLDHLKRHLAAPHMKVYSEQVKDLRNGMELTVLTPA